MVPFGPLLAALAEIRDPRRPQGQRYSMSHLLLFSVLAVLAGATSYQRIVTFIAVQRDRRKAAHLLSAFASDAALILAHQEVAGAPGEIPAVPMLITELGLTGVLFTADALHCQKEGFTRAAETGNALLVRVKDNQPKLHDALAGLCVEQLPLDSYETVDRRRHGRQEHRVVEVFDAAGRLDGEWQPL